MAIKVAKSQKFKVHNVKSMSIKTFTTYVISQKRIQLTRFISITQVAKWMTNRAARITVLNFWILTA